MHAWNSANGLPVKKFKCGHCGELVSSVLGYTTNIGTAALMYICPNCADPTYFKGGRQIPGPVAGNKVEYLPSELEALYLEARNCVSVGANTASVLACRKLLMHIAVAQGANAGESFISYVEYLANSGFVPPNGKGWVDHIRKKGNEANHEIALMGQGDADELISFLEMLLKFIYEFPSRVPAATPAKAL